MRLTADEQAAHRAFQLALGARTERLMAEAALERARLAERIEIERLQTAMARLGADEELLA